MSIKELSKSIGSIDTTPITLEESLSMIKAVRVDVVRGRRVKHKWFEPIRNWRIRDDASQI